MVWHTTGESEIVRDAEEKETFYTASRKPTSSEMAALRGFRSFRVPDAPASAEGPLQSHGLHTFSHCGLKFLTPSSSADLQGGLIVHQVRTGDRCRKSGFVSK